MYVNTYITMYESVLVAVALEAAPYTFQSLCRAEPTIGGSRLRHVVVCRFKCMSPVRQVEVWMDSPPTTSCDSSPSKLVSTTSTLLPLAAVS